MNLMAEVDNSHDQFEEEEGEDETTPLDQEKKKKLFTKELRCMMFGFGDDKDPYSESVDLLEDLVVEFISEMTKKAYDVGRPGRISVEDIIFIIRKDPKKFARVKELLTMNEELRQARKAFDESMLGKSTSKPAKPEKKKAT